MPIERMRAYALRIQEPHNLLYLIALDAESPAMKDLEVIQYGQVWLQPNVDTCMHAASSLTHAWRRNNI